MFTKILVPLDGSALAEYALPLAVAMASQSKGEIILVRVPIYVTPYMGGEGAWVLPQLSPELLIREATDYLTKIEESYARPGINWHIATPAGDEASAIVDIANQRQADLIVMSTHGYSGATRWLLGSITEKVLQKAHCPVLAIRNNNPIQKIAVTVDGSALSEQAIEPAIKIADAFNASLTLLRCYEPPLFSHSAMIDLEWRESGLASQFLEQQLNQLRDYMEGLVVRFQQAGRHLNSQIVEGPAGPTILEFATQNELDLLVMATHGRGGLQRWVYGSVTQKVLREAQSALLVVRPPIDDTPNSPGHAI